MCGRRRAGIGLRFRRRIRIAPGVNLNLSKSGVGISTGVKGLRVSEGPSGTRLTASIPGTGVSYVVQGKKGNRRKQRTTAKAQSVATQEMRQMYRNKKEAEKDAKRLREQGWIAQENWEIPILESRLHKLNPFARKPQPQILVAYGRVPGTKQ